MDDHAQELHAQDETEDDQERQSCNERMSVTMGSSSGNLYDLNLWRDQQITYQGRLFAGHLRSLW